MDAVCGAAAGGAAGAGGSRNLAFRLTNDGIMDRSGELLGRIDTPSNFFVKEFAGIGSAQSRDMNDEDWAIPAGPGNGIPKHERSQS